MGLDLSPNLLPIVVTILMWLTFAVVWVKTRDI
jgi:hypothetical protein